MILNAYSQNISDWEGIDKQRQAFMLLE